MVKSVKNILAISSVLLFICAISFAAEVRMLEPIAATISEGETVDLGTIGPGQTLAITVKGIEIGKGELEANWGVLGVLEVPKDWQGFDSMVFAKNMRATIKADPNAPDGTYIVKMILTECESKNEICEAKQGLGSVTFFGRVKISREVMKTSMPTVGITTGVGQPARYPIRIENKGAASDVFEIYSEGVPAWDMKKTIHVAPGQTINTFYEIAVNEEKEYKPTIVIKSVSSDRLKHTYDVGLTVKSDVIGDIKATKNGILIFPLTLEPLYTLMGIFSYAFA
ncbi:MAG: hypothetical protein N3G74_01270 [Candidatus Micrarchaeota archaeon]|nr:hypothetical protein [Candidatus Micrarchaeota archaeon]